MSGKFSIEIHSNPSGYDFEGSIADIIEAMDNLHRYLLDGHDPRIAHTKIDGLKRSNRNHVSTRALSSQKEEIQRSSFDITLKQIKDNATR